MSQRVALLERGVAERIAAGEVIERPASVIKELVENSIDAGATRVWVDLVDGGQTRLQITDDGCGMSREDVALAINRFATSKIRSWDDVENLHTLGFRGEALPSVVAVSRLELLTRESSAETGTRLVARATDPVVLEEAGCPVGTTATVTELFFNTPARRKFLKSAAAETGRIVDLLGRFSLLHTNIHFRLTAGGREVFNFPPQYGLVERLKKLWHFDVRGGVAEVAHQEGDARISGVVFCPPTFAPTRARQCLFVNGRLIVNVALSQALAQGFEPLVPDRKFPMAVLFIEIPPLAVDVNVHPTKSEVRFLYPRQIFKLVRDSVAAALVRNQARPTDPTRDIARLQRPARSEAPSLVARRDDDGAFFRGDGNDARGDDPTFRGHSNVARGGSNVGRGDGDGARGGSDYARANGDGEREDSPAFRADSPAFRGDSDGARGDSDGARGDGPAFRGDGDGARGDSLAGPTSRDPHRRPLLAEVQAAMEAATPLSPRSPKQGLPEGRSSRLEAPNVGDAGPDLELAGLVADDALPGITRSIAEISPRTEPRWQVLTQLHRTYIVCLRNTELWLVDQHTAHERINYERLAHLSDPGHACATQPLLFPIMLELPADEGAALSAQLEIFAELGYEIEPFGGETFVVRALPAGIKALGKPEVLRQIIAEMLHDERSSEPQRLRELLRATTACRASVMAGDVLTREEMEALLVGLEQIPRRGYCPHGRPVSVRLTEDDLARLFHRR